MTYTAPSEMRIGHVHLKVSDLDQSVAFYTDVLGLAVTERLPRAAFLSAGGYHHHIGLNTWDSLDGPAPAPGTTGLFHTAFLYPSRKDLARAAVQVIDHGVAFTGAADHGVSQAIYFDDPDGNGIELCWDRPRTQWPLDPDGNLRLPSRKLDLPDLFALGRGAKRHETESFDA